MRKELIDAGAEIMLNLLERKLRQLADRANAQVTNNNAFPSGCISRIMDTRLLMKHTITELVDLSAVIEDIAKEILHDEER